jgi:hypothetical protein
LRGEVLFLSKNAPDDAACGAKIPEEWFRYGAGQKNFIGEGLKRKETISCSFPH